MIRLLSLFLIFILLSEHSSADLSSPSLKLIHNNSKEKKVDWKTKTFIIEKTFNKFNHKIYQTWIALPPLLELIPDKPNYNILDNTEESRSPFSKSESIKKVLLFEHFSPSTALELKKNNKASNSNLILKIDTLKKSITHMTRACTKLGVSINELSKITFPMSIDCRELSKVIHFSITGPLSLEKDFKSEKGVRITSKEKNRIEGSFDLTSINVIGTILKDGSKKNNFIKIRFKKIETNKSKFYTQTEGKQRKHSSKISPDTESKNHERRFLFNIGLLGSKLGTELDFLALYSLPQPGSHLALHATFPTRIIGSDNKANTFFETSLTFNKSTMLSDDYVLTFGGGLRSILFGESIVTDVAVLGPEIRLGFSKKTFIYDRFQYSSSLVLVPIYFNSNITGSRLLWELINLSLYDFNEHTLSLSLRYSHILYKTDNFRFSDSKFLGGVILTW